MKSDQPARIVLIEDNPEDIFLLRHTLESYGEQYRLEVLEDGDKALRFVREYCGHACGPSPCVLVLDLHLPKHDGAEILRAIRQERSLSGVRVVVLTGLTSAKEETRIRSLGVQLYRNKPADLEGYHKLAEEIITICNEHSLKAAV